MRNFFSIAIFCLTFLLIACNDAPKTTNTHTHEDGSVHEDHAADSAKPDQQQFNVGDTAAVPVDSAPKPHVHEDGKEHTH